MNRRRKLAKCLCGRREIPFAGYNQRRYLAAACPVLDFVDRHNEMCRRFKERRAGIRTEEN